MAKSENFTPDKRWTLREFCKDFGNPKWGEFKNKTTGEPFCKMMFGNINLCWGESIGELSRAQVKAQREDLQVILAYGKYILCKQSDGANIKPMDDLWD